MKEGLYTFLAWSEDTIKIVRPKMGFKEIYLVLTYRLGESKFKEIVTFYSKLLGSPIIKIDEKIVVFSIKHVHQHTNTNK